MMMKLAETAIEQLWLADEALDIPREEASRSLAAKVAEVEGLRPLPHVAQRLIRVLGDSDFGIRDLSKVISEDPSIATKVLRLANSAYFRRGKPSRRILDAVVRLGARTVNDIVLGVAAMQMFTDSTGMGAAIRDHCVSVGSLAQFVARRFLPTYEDGLFLAGMLHDLGKLLLLQTCEIKYLEMDAALRNQPDQAHLFERKELGYDHGVLGGLVLQRWSFPPPVPEVVAFHHQPARAFDLEESAAAMVTLIRFVDCLEPLVKNNVGAPVEELEVLEESSENQILGITFDRLHLTWYDFIRARNEGLSIMGSR